MEETNIYYVSPALAELNEHMPSWPNLNTQASVDTGTALFPLEIKLRLLICSVRLIKSY